MRRTVCKKCGTAFTEAELTKLKRVDCKKCENEYSRIKMFEKSIRENLEKMKDRTDLPTCKICGYRASNLYCHIKGHHISVEEYKQKYNCTIDDLQTSEYTEQLSNRVKGENNPAYQHGGKFSPFSKKFVKYNDLTDEETKEKIKEICDKSSVSQKENGNNSTLLNYWLKQGFNEEEAREKLKERQQTFSLEKCIDKYGEEAGLKRWQERQEKWFKSMPYSNYSKISQKLFNNIYDYFTQKNIILNYKYATKNYEYIVGMFRLDFYIEELNYGIEFFGDYYHMNPAIYKEHNIMNGLTAKDIWERDLTKLEYICNQGINLKLVWENDYKQNPDIILEQIITEIEELYSQKFNK